MISHKFVLHIKQGLNYKTTREESWMAGTYRLKGIELGSVPKGVSLLAVAVFRLSRALRSETTKVVSRDNGPGLVSWRIMAGLSLVDEATQKQLVEFTRIGQAQISRHLGDMLDQGLIGARPSQIDRRTKLFFLKDLGRQTHAKLYPDVARLSGAMDRALSHHEQLQFLEMCARIEAAAKQAAQDLPESDTPTVRNETGHTLQEAIL
jgi:DNA-binding MarR family transcriptional regulator